MQTKFNGVSNVSNSGNSETALREKQYERADKSPGVESRTSLIQIAWVLPFTLILGLVHFNLCYIKRSYMTALSLELEINRHHSVGMAPQRYAKLLWFAAEPGVQHLHTTYHHDETQSENRSPARGNNFRLSGQANTTTTVVTFVNHFYDSSISLK